MYSCNICDYNNKTNSYYCTKKQNLNFENNKLEKELIKSKDKDKDNEIKNLKQRLIDSKIVNRALLNYMELLMQDKHNLELRNYKRKCIIPPTVKNVLWYKYFNNNITGKCCCCKIENISIGNFVCGYIISKCNGGTESVNNLKPICRLCKSSIKTMNMDDFMNKYGLNCITI